MDLRRRKASSLTSLLLWLFICGGISWSTSLQQNQEEAIDPIVNYDQKFRENGNEKQVKGTKIIYVHLDKIPVRSGRPFDFKNGTLETVKASDGDAYNTKDGSTSSQYPIRTSQNEHTEERRVRLPGSGHKKSGFRPLVFEIFSAFRKPWQYCRILSDKEGMFSGLKHLFKAIQTHVKNWFSSAQKEAPSVWSRTEPLAIIEPVAPALTYPQCTLNDRLRFVLQQVMLEPPLLSTGHISCAGAIEEAAAKLRKALSSRLQIDVCSANVSPCEKEFCDFLESSPKLASLMVFSKFGINLAEVAISHSVGTGACTSSTEMSHLSDSIHHVMRLGHRVREGLSLVDLRKKGQPSGISFWKSLFSGNQTSCQACLHQVVDNVKVVMKRHLATHCREAKCPKLVSTCSFLKEHKHLARILLMLKLQPWRFAAHTCAAERACSSFPMIVSNWGRAHERDARHAHNLDRVHTIVEDAQMPAFPNFLAFPRHACRKAMLFRRSSEGLFPFSFGTNGKFVHNPVKFFFDEPRPERISTDLDAMISLLQKFPIHVPFEMHNPHERTLNILSSLHDVIDGQEAEGKLILNAISEDTFKVIHDGLKHPLREEAQVQATGGGSSKIENEVLKSNILSASTNEAPSHADM